MSSTHAQIVTHYGPFGPAWFTKDAKSIKPPSSSRMLSNREDIGTTPWFQEFTYWTIRAYLDQDGWPVDQAWVTSQIAQAVEQKHRDAPERLRASDIESELQAWRKMMHEQSSRLTPAIREVLVGPQQEWSDLSRHAMDVALRTKTQAIGKLASVSDEQLSVDDVQSALLEIIDRLEAPDRKIAADLVRR